MVDMDAHYTIEGWSKGIAWRLQGYATQWTQEDYIYDGPEWTDQEDDPHEDLANYIYCEPEEITDYNRVRAVMVGDDRVFEVDVDDLVVIPEDSFCRDCGQIGCGCNVYT